VNKSIAKEAKKSAGTNENLSGLESKLDAAKAAVEQAKLQLGISTQSYETRKGKTVAADVDDLANSLGLPPKSEALDSVRSAISTAREADLAKLEKNKNRNQGEYDLLLIQEVEIRQEIKDALKQQNDDEAKKYQAQKVYYAKRYKRQEMNESAERFDDASSVSYNERGALEFDVRQRLENVDGNVISGYSDDVDSLILAATKMIENFTVEVSKVLADDKFTLGARLKWAQANRKKRQDWIDHKALLDKISVVMNALEKPDPFNKEAAGVLKSLMIADGTFDAVDFLEVSILSKQGSVGDYDYSDYGVPEFEEVEQPMPVTPTVPSSGATLSASDGMEGYESDDTEADTVELHSYKLIHDAFLSVGGSMGLSHIF